MAHSVRDQRDSPANQLRAALDEAERSVARLGSDEVEPFLVRLDWMEEQFARMESDGLDLRPERTRQESLLSRLESEPALITRPAAHAGGLAALRANHPPATGGWWHLDVLEAERRRRLMRRLVTSVSVLVGVLLAIYITITYVFPPDPNAVLASDASGRLPELVSNGKWEEADALLASTLSRMTETDPELLIWRSVVSAHLGRQAEAEEAFAQAQAATPAGREAVFWSTVGNVYLAAGDLAKADEAARKALAVDPNEAQAYFVLGSIGELTGDIQMALENFDKAFELASESNPQLAVIARVRMGMIMQGAPPVGPVTTTVPAGP